MSQKGWLFFKKCQAYFRDGRGPGLVGFFGVRGLGLEPSNVIVCLKPKVFRWMVISFLVIIHAKWRVKYIWIYILCTMICQFFVPFHIMSSMFDRFTKHLFLAINRFWDVWLVHISGRRTSRTSLGEQVDHHKCWECLDLGDGLVSMYSFTTKAYFLVTCTYIHTLILSNFNIFCFNHVQCTPNFLFKYLNMIIVLDAWWSGSCRRDASHWCAPAGELFCWFDHVA